MANPHLPFPRVHAYTERKELKRAREKDDETGVGKGGGIARKKEREERKAMSDEDGTGERL